jgi:hypothetical protein
MHQRRSPTGPSPTIWPPKPRRTRPLVLDAPCPDLSVQPRIIGINHRHGKGMVAVSADSELEQLADAAVSDWPGIALSGRFDACIEDLYRSQLKFPPSWPQELRDEFITSNAEIDTIELSAKFDDVIDTVVDRYVRDHGVHPHHDDAAALIDAERRAAIHELEFRLVAMANEIAEATAHSLGRTEASMTGCSPAHRRSQAATRHRRRNRR